MFYCKDTFFLLQLCASLSSVKLWIMLIHMKMFVQGSLMCLVRWFKCVMGKVRNHSRVQSCFRKTSRLNYLLNYLEIVFFGGRGEGVLWKEKILVVSMKKFSIIYVCTANVGPSCLCFMEISDFFNDENCLVLLCYVPEYNKESVLVLVVLVKNILLHKIAHLKRPHCFPQLNSATAPGLWRECLIISSRPAADASAFYQHLIVHQPQLLSVIGNDEFSLDRSRWLWVRECLSRRRQWTPHNYEMEKQ